MDSQDSGEQMGNLHYPYPCKPFFLLYLTIPRVRETKVSLTPIISLLAQSSFAVTTKVPGGWRERRSPVLAGAHTNAQVPVGRKMWHLFEKNLISKACFFCRVLKDLSQPKAEWNFPTEATERSKTLIFYELILRKTQLIWDWRVSFQFRYS